MLCLPVQLTRSFLNFLKRINHSVCCWLLLVTHEALEPPPTPCLWCCTFQANNLVGGIMGDEGNVDLSLKCHRKCLQERGGMLALFFREPVSEVL